MFERKLNCRPTINKIFTADGTVLLALPFSHLLLNCFYFITHSVTQTTWTRIHIQSTLVTTKLLGQEIYSVKPGLCYKRSRKIKKNIRIQAIWFFQICSFQQYFVITMFFISRVDCRLPFLGYVWLSYRFSQILEQPTFGCDVSFRRTTL